LSAHKPRDELLKQVTAISLRDGGSRMAFCEKQNAIALWSIIVLGVWHPVAFSGVKPRIIVLLRDSSAGKQIPFI
jgi:hypothetical protein